MNLRDQLQAIYDHRGELTPEVLVDEARPATHPLHDRFEWDDRLAGESWRRHQAHEMIQSVRITYAPANGQPTSIRAFHAIRGNGGTFRYEPTERVVQDPILTALVRHDMERDVRQLTARYERFEEFWALMRSTVAAGAARR